VEKLEGHAMGDQIKGRLHLSDAVGGLLHYYNRAVA
jgi:hypothetical protein